MHRIMVKFLKITSTRKTPGFARLCSRSRFRLVGEILGNLFCLDLTDDSIFKKIYLRQVANRIRRSNLKTGSFLVTFFSITFHACFQSMKFTSLAKRRASPGYARNRGFGSSGKFVLSRFLYTVDNNEQ